MPDTYNYDDPVSQLLASYAPGAPQPAFLSPIAPQFQPAPAAAAPITPAITPTAPAPAAPAPSPISAPDAPSGGGLKLPTDQVTNADLPIAGAPADSLALKLPSSVPTTDPLSDIRVSPTGQASPSTLMGAHNAAAAENSKAGLDTLWGKTGHIDNPFLRTLARVGTVGLHALNAAGGMVAPQILAAIPGTPLHHEEQVRDLETIAAQQQARDKGQQDLANAAAEQDVKTENAQAAGLQAQAAMIKATNEKHNFETVNSRGLLWTHDKNTDRLVPLTDASGKQLTSPETGQPSIHQLADGTVVSAERDPATGEVKAHVVYKGDPKVETHITQLEVGGKPHQVLVNSNTGEQIRDLGESGEKPPVVNVNAGDAALDKESARFAKVWEANHTAANNQLDKITEAQGMIAGNAEAQALGIPKVLTALVSGAGSGVRVTQPELNALASARGLSGDISGTLSKWAGKGTLTKTQQKQLNGLLEDVKQRILLKQTIASETLSSINSGASRDQIIAADKAGHDRLDAFERNGKGGGNNDTINVKVGNQTGPIHASQWAQFKKDHPDAEQVK